MHANLSQNTIHIVGEIQDSSHRFPEAEEEEKAKFQYRLEILKASEGKLPFIPKGWQLDVASMLLFGQSVLLLAGTGSGKSLSFVLPGLVSGKPTLVLSPLNALEEDQAAAFQKWGLRAVSLNSGSCSKTALKDIRNGLYDVVITSPELIMESQRWRSLVASPKFRDLWGLVVVDEAHCIIQWGIAHGTRKAFRPAWGNIGQIQALISSETPILAATATLMVHELPVIRSLLHMRPKTYTVNLGNHRPEIFMEYYEMKHSMVSMQDLLSLVVPKRGTIKSTMVCFDDRDLAHRAQEHLQKALPSRLKGSVAVYHALRTTEAKMDMMVRFCQGDIKILVCTEAAGMGCDIPHVEVVIQWRVPKTLGMWLQRVGRAARGPSMHGHAILLTPEGFQKDLAEKIRKNQVLEELLNSPRTEIDEDVGGDVILQSDVNQTTRGSRKQKTRGKNNRRAPKVKLQREPEPPCDEAMTEWVLANMCHRFIQDKYYANPRRTEVIPSTLCCDWCRDNHQLPPRTPSLFLTPLPMPGSQHSIELEPDMPDANGKRKQGKKQHTKVYWEELFELLLQWRDEEWE